MPSDREDLYARPRVKLSRKRQLARKREDSKRRRLAAKQDPSSSSSDDDCKARDAADRFTRVSAMLTKARVDEGLLRDTSSESSDAPPTNRLQVSGGADFSSSDEDSFPESARRKKVRKKRKGSSGNSNSNTGFY